MTAPVAWSGRYQLLLIGVNWEIPGLGVSSPGFLLDARQVMSPLRACFFFLVVGGAARAVRTDAAKFPTPGFLGGSAGMWLDSPEGVAVHLQGWSGGGHR